MTLDVAIVSLYVKDIARARELYEGILGLSVIENLSSHTFVTLRPGHGSLIGLQDAKTAPRAVRVEPGGVEVGIEVLDVDAVWSTLKEKGVEVLGPPVEMPFGLTFLARDQDGHVLRVYKARRAR